MFDALVFEKRANKKTSQHLLNDFCAILAQFCASTCTRKWSIGAYRYLLVNSYTNLYKSTNENAVSGVKIEPN